MAIRLRIVRTYTANSCPMMSHEARPCNLQHTNSLLVVIVETRAQRRYLAIVGAGVGCRCQNRVHDFVHVIFTFVHKMSLGIRCPGVCEKSATSSANYAKVYEQINQICGLSPNSST